MLGYSRMVALLAEGVDRNIDGIFDRLAEMVALLAEGVDRNIKGAIKEACAEMSPSSQRAWIEI